MTGVAKDAKVNAAMLEVARLASIAVRQEREAWLRFMRQVQQITGRRA